MLVPQLKIETSKKNQHINSNNILAGLQKNNCAKKNAIQHSITRHRHTYFIQKYKQLC